jgi:acyl carrier protein|tara:strand:+ start:328 stop:561 length:234 start_codon:yes stop_codon:yes gene_type:complete
MATTYERVQKLISKTLSINIDDIKQDSHFFDNLNFDSLDAIEIVMNVEEEFDVEILDDDVDGILTVQQLITFIDENS